MSESARSRRAAQDLLILLFLALAGAGLSVAGPLLAVPIISLIGTPIALLSAAGFALCVLALGQLDVGWPRSIAGVLASLGGLGLFFWSYLTGLGVIAEHYLGRAGAPTLSELWGAGLSVAVSMIAVGGSVSLRRRQGLGAATAAAVIGTLSAGLGWILLVVMGELGFPFGA